jgi:3-methylcrotonyl-CoA carboxylase alpha subunit
MKLRWKDEVREVDEARPPAGLADCGRIHAFVDGDRVFVWCRGRSYELSVVRDTVKARGARRGEGSGGLLSPMPGRIRKVHVGVGDRVSKGQVLLVLEAMKMEHAIRSPHDGSVTRLAFAEGDLVEAGAELAEVSPD